MLKIMCKINGKKLVELRTEAGVSQAQLARETGISPSSINKYEKGTLNPSDEVVSKICLVLNINKDDIEIHEVGYNFLAGESKIIEGVRKKKGFVRYMIPSETQAWIKSKRDSSNFDFESEIKNALNNKITFYGKTYIQIDPRCLNVPNWQRDTDMASVEEIAINFNDMKFDPIKAYLEGDTKLVNADGVHRCCAMIKYNEENKIKLKAIVELLNCNEDEAIDTFLNQKSGRNNMTTSDMYRAAVKRNIKEYVNFKHMFEENGIQITTDEVKLDNPIGSITPSIAILRMVENDTEYLTKSINLIKKLEWCGSEKNAFILRNFKVIKKLYANFGEDTVEEKMMQNCWGAVYYESKIVPVKGEANLYDFLSSEICK